MLSACYPNEQTRFDIWAQYVSVRARYPDGTPPADQLDVDEMQRLRSRYRLSDRAMIAIDKEARQKGWQSSLNCRPDPQPVRMHVLLLSPKPTTEIRGQGPATGPLAVQGVASVVAVIRADGTVADARIYSGLSPVLDTQAVAAVRSARWLPARLCGRAVAAELLVNVPFNFPRAAV
ncbi:MAG TPA: energy transducer TonB [Thermoanaerobaculia bacterium]|nr:energy transducer TonB [Thermoanaerobaculia bacterium]